MFGKCVPQGPGDPCDSGAMAAAAMLYLGFIGSLIVGILVSIATFIILMKKIKRVEKQNPE